MVGPGIALTGSVAVCTQWKMCVWIQGQISHGDMILCLEKKGGTLFIISSFAFINQNTYKITNNYTQ